MKRKYTIFIFIIMIVCLKTDSTLAQGADRNLMIVLVPDFSFQEVEWLLEREEANKLWKTGGMAAMNIRPDGPYSYLNNTVSLSSGSRSVGVQGWNAYEKGELENGVFVEELYQQWTGKYVLDNVIFHPLLHKLVDKNQDSAYRSQVGSLGEKIKQNSVDRYVLGNSDFQDEKVRYGSLFTMDKEGFTPGELLSATKADSSVAGGLTMDVDSIVENLSTINQKGSSIFIIEWGDLYRLYKQKDVMDQEYFQVQYERALLHLEDFLTQLVSDSSVDVTWLLSPMVHSDAYAKKERLAPFFYWSNNGDIFSVTSRTSKQAFVISNLDIYPTILNYFDIPDDRSYGTAIDIEIVKEPLYSTALENIRLIFKIFETRNIILSSYITLLVLLLIIVSIVLHIREKKAAWKKTAKILLIGGLSSPLWLLLTPYMLNYIQANVYLVLLLFCSFITGYLFVNYVPRPVFAISVCIFVALTLDLVFGNALIQRSYLGYDPIIGARYYGIGNEFAGVYLISGLILLEYSAVRKWFVFFIVALGQIVILTRLGANAGATLSAGIMYGYYFSREYFSNLSWRSIFMIGVAMIPLMVVSLYLLQLGKESHISLAFEKLISGDFVYIVDTIKRKIEMNWKIFRFSNWTQLFVTTYLLIALYLWKGKKVVSNQTRQRLIRTGIVASIALLFLNDSGVVAAATSMFMIVCTSYYWSLDEG